MKHQVKLDASFLSLVIAVAVVEVLLLASQDALEVMGVSE